MEDLVNVLTCGKKNIVVIGEAGSGKTEVSLSMAAALQKAGPRQVHLFDMDQTKPILRARDSANTVTREGVSFHYQAQFMDAPIVASGVIERLADPDSLVILDIGGGEYGSHMIGQFEEELNNDNTLVLFLLNPYRAWSGCREYIDETIRRTVGAAHLNQITLAANPNLGYETDAAVILRGLDRISELMPDLPVHFVCVDPQFVSEVEAGCSIPVFPVNLTTFPNWIRD